VAGTRQAFDQPRLLLGRRTYEISRRIGPTPKADIAKPFIGHEVCGDAQRRGPDLEMLGGAARRGKDVAKLKQEDGPPLITQGSAELVHSLLAAGPRR